MGEVSSESEISRVALAEKAKKLRSYVESYGAELADGTIRILQKGSLETVWVVNSGAEGIVFGHSGSGMKHGVQVEVAVLPEGELLVGVLRSHLLRSEKSVVAAYWGVAEDGRATNYFEETFGGTSAMSYVEMVEEVADLVASFATAEKKRWFASDPKFAELARLVWMLCWAHNPHLFIKGSSLGPVDDKAGGTTPAMPEAERKALIGNLKLAMRKFLAEAKDDQRLRFSAFGRAVEGLRDGFFDLEDLASTMPEELGGEQLRDSLRAAGFLDQEAGESGSDGEGDDGDGRSPTGRIDWKTK